MQLLGDDLETQALSALENEATPELIEVFGDPQAVVAAAREHARHNPPRHEAFARAWQELMRRVEEEP